jgi:hypothetical protein
VIWRAFGIMHYVDVCVSAARVQKLSSLKSDLRCANMRLC